MNGGWSQVEAAGKSADVYDPPGGRPRFGVLHLHGQGLKTLRDRPAFTSLFDELRLSCTCPHGGRCWWADRVCPDFHPTMTPERYLVEAALPFVRERWGLAPRAVALLGVGMGGQGALRLAFKRPDLFPVVAALAPEIEHYQLYGADSSLEAMYEGKEQCRQDSVPMHVHPSRFPPHLFFAADPDDPWFRGADRLREKLNALGVEHEADLTTRAGGHSWAYFNRMAQRAVRLLANGLEMESRRLL